MLIFLRTVLLCVMAFASFFSVHSAELRPSWAGKCVRTGKSVGQNCRCDVCLMPKIIQSIRDVDSPDGIDKLKEAIGLLKIPAFKKKGKERVLRLKLQKATVLNMSNGEPFSITPLHTAVLCYKPSVIHLLCGTYGVDPNELVEYDGARQMLLQCLMFPGHEESEKVLFQSTAWALLKEGADPNLQDSTGLSAFDLAKEDGCLEAEWLREVLEKRNCEISPFIEQPEVPKKNKKKKKKKKKPAATVVVPVPDTLFTRSTAGCDGSIFEGLPPELARNVIPLHDFHAPALPGMKPKSQQIIKGLPSDLVGNIKLV